MEGGGAFNLDRQLRVIVAGADGTEEQTVPLEIAVQFRFFKDILCLDGAEVVTADLAQAGLSPGAVCHKSFAGLVELVQPLGKTLQEVLEEATMYTLLSTATALGLRQDVLERLDQKCAALLHSGQHCDLVCYVHQGTSRYNLQHRYTPDSAAIVVPFARWAVLQFWRFLDQHSLMKTLQAVTTYMLHSQALHEDAIWRQQLDELFLDPNTSMSGRLAMYQLNSSVNVSSTSLTLNPELVAALDKLTFRDLLIKSDAGSGKLFGNKCRLCRLGDTTYTLFHGGKHIIGPFTLYKKPDVKPAETP
eukprot:jgi/Chrzof1/3806/Cz13g09150.t1